MIFGSQWSVCTLAAQLPQTPDYQSFLRNR
jgi:hypothetical protein